MSEDKTICPHCGQKMKKFKAPDSTTWGETCWYVCYNDDCGYYKRGWDHMWNTMKVKCSYRHRYDPDTNSCGPMPVYSPTMGLECVVEE
ncbi:MAG: ogr/Delta-like zinc finger family protein [Thermodesulfobacteriota bacterium]